MPPPRPPEFRQRAVELARTGDAAIAKIAKDLGISESCLRNWMRADLPDDNGSSSEKKELAGSYSPWVIEGAAGWLRP